MEIINNYMHKGTHVMNSIISAIVKVRFSNRVLALADDSFYMADDDSVAYSGPILNHTTKEWSVWAVKSAHYTLTPLRFIGSSSVPIFRMVAPIADTPGDTQSDWEFLMQALDEAPEPVKVMWIEWAISSDGKSSPPTLTEAIEWLGSGEFRA